VVAERRPERMTVEEWRALERESHDVKHEYIDGYVYAMAGGSLAHAHIAANILGLLFNALAGGPCIAYTSDAATQVSATRYTYADVVVACDGDEVASREQTELHAPRVIFEVLSESTERKDRGRKWDDYRQCPTLHEYVLVGTEYQRVEVYRRTDQGWGLFHIYGPGDEVELPSIDARFSVTSLYGRTDVPLAPPEDPGPPGAGN
jgi:Uma2 family endonuclease